ncbi:MAG: multiheme c-type cytochrome [Pseudomonadota bacterium]
MACIFGLGACQGEPGALPPLPPRQTEARAPAGPERPVRRLILAYVGEVRGELDVCGCPTQPVGGFERRAGLLGELQAEGPAVFQLDAGNLLVEGFSTGGRGDVPERARLMLDLSADVGLDAFCPGPADLAAMDVVTLAHELEARGLAAVSATWLDPEGRPLLPPAAVLQRDGVRVGVVGLSAAPRGDAIVSRDPVEAAREALAALPDDLDLVVALSNLSDDDALRVAREVAGFAALLSVRNSAYAEPSAVGHTLLAKVPGRGRYVGVLRVRTSSTPGMPLDLVIAEDLRLSTFDRLSARAFGLERRGSLVPDEERRSLDQLQASLEKEGVGRNLAWYTAVPLGDRYAGDTGIHARVESFKQENLREAGERLAAQEAGPGGPRRYVSSTRCVGCHTAQTARWSLTRHPQAWEALISRGSDQDPECVTCHATGFAMPGGWAELSPQNTLRFKAVQCEACHGPLEGHPQDPASRPVLPDRDTCTGCHDDANSPDFDYASYLPRATCSVRASERAPVSTGSGANAPAGVQEVSP